MCFRKTTRQLYRNIFQDIDRIQAHLPEGTAKIIIMLRTHLGNLTEK